jgi:caspase domain-containing protein
MRDIATREEPSGTDESTGRNLIAVVGVDCYQHWHRLSNAVRDATGAAELFQQLGFEHAVPPLLDEAATFKAMWSLVTDDLKSLGPNDSLVMFFAGHGSTQTHHLGNEIIKTGYLIPVDAENKVSTWIELGGWLRAVALVPAKHILVILDACHSGLALDPVIKWRDTNSWRDEPLATLKVRRSRRVITSALDNQLALDTGPVHGHSLFTGCLVEALRYGLRSTSNGVTTGSELGLYIQKRVRTYPHSKQTPDFGTFAFDDRGEMAIPLQAAGANGLVEYLQRCMDADDIDSIRAWLWKDSAILDQVFPNESLPKSFPRFWTGWEMAGKFFWNLDENPSKFTIIAIMLGPVSEKSSKSFSSELDHFLEFLRDRYFYYKAEHRYDIYVEVTATILVGRRSAQASSHRTAAASRWKEWHRDSHLDYLFSHALKIRSYDAVLDACRYLSLPRAR